MTLRSRLKQLEAHAPDPWPDPPDNYPTLAAAVGELDGLIRRLDEQVREQEENPDGFVEGSDDARYGLETLGEHVARVDALMDALDERHEAWRREHRPDLVGVPNEIDAHIAELKAEITLLEGEG
ncbi:MAG: hypothetical protein H0U02_00455 [Rubrobacter sp.]|nr:hypothetical protein [Rubrobacter sp.]